jgi:hypothetical protein
MQLQKKNILKLYIMRKLLMIAVLLFGMNSFGQEDFKKPAKEDLRKLSNEFVLKQTEFKIQDSIFKLLTSKISTSTNDSDFLKIK